MWVAERFPSLELLLDFLNDRAIPAERCKIAAVPEPAGGAVWHLLYQPDAEPSGGLAAVAAIEADAPLPDDAIASAEAIIHDAQREDAPAETDNPA
jgi:hypothetical protein